MFIAQPRAVMEVEVKVLRRLIVAAVGGKPAAAVLRGEFAAKVGREGEHFLDDGQVAGFELRERRDVALRDDDDVNRPIGLCVVEREHIRGFGDPPHGRLAC